MSADVLKYNFNSIELCAWNIYKSYSSFVKKRGYYKNFLPTKNDPRDGKNWQYFIEIANKYDKDHSFDPYLFIEAQFRDLPKNKMIYPAQLKTKISDKKYELHRESKKIVDVISNTEKIMLSLKDTAIAIQKKLKQEGYEKSEIYRIFEKEEGDIYSDGSIMCIYGFISKYFMSVSKSFLNEYKSLDIDLRQEIITKEELKQYRINLKLDDDAYRFAKEIFKDEII